MDSMLVVLVVAALLLTVYTVLHPIACRIPEPTWLIWLRYMLLISLLALTALFYCLTVNASQIEQSVLDWDSAKNARVWRSVSMGMLSLSILATLVLTYVLLDDLR